TVVFGGDVVLCAEVEKRVERYGEGYVFKGMADLFSHADVVAINLENPLTNSDKKAPKPTPSGHEAPVYLKARPEAGKVLSAGGIDVAFLANNHIGDYEGGVVDTTKALRGLGILPVGAGENSQEAYRPVIVEVRGTKLAFLAFCDVRPRSFEAEDSRLGSAWAHPKAMQAAIAKARKGADVVFVNLHFGGQHNTVPSERQKQLAGLALRAGADMVIGNHPHVIQPVAGLQGKPVLFSLGNLVLPMPRYSWSIGLVAKVVIVGKKIRRVDLIPIQIVDLTQPQRIHGHHILDNLYESSKVFGDLQTIKNGFLLLETPLLPAVPKQPPSD
ncbi:CapA family protein, partial [bacterium]|nr:CapA family protein [bacterium]